MDRNIDEVEFTIFDTETTGLEPETGDRIVEVAAMRFKAEKIIATFDTLVNPHREVSPAAFQVNHITQEVLESAPDSEIVLPKFLDFIRGSCLCSYNIGFDLKFLNNELKLSAIELPKDVLAVDILKMAKRLMPGSERYALWFVSEKLGIITEQKHRAFSDVELTLKVFYKFKEMLKLKGIVDFKNFLRLFSVDQFFLNNINNERIAQIQEAIDLGVKLKIKYLSSSGAEVTQREVFPKEIKQENGNSYLVGFCSLRNDERTFRIDGILHLEII
ncbi:MAG: exonuclease domain-containing protein [Candidatus Omnitrophota bacterium]